MTQPTGGESDAVRVEAAKRDERRAEARKIERARWAELQFTDERCVKIADAVWTKRIEDAAAQQQALAEAMRDRRTERHAANFGDANYMESSEIPVPLFTPRDRIQFVKEVATHLNIEAGHRNLCATYRDKDDDDSTPEAPEAVNQTVETDAATEAKELADAGERADKIAAGHLERATEIPYPKAGESGRAVSGTP